MLIWLAGDGAAAERPLRGMQRIGELVHSVAHPKAVPVYGESGCECNEQTKGEQLGDAKCRKLFPLSLAFGLPAPP